MPDERDRQGAGRRPPKQQPTWTDEEVLQVLTAQGYITRCELGSPEFVGLRPLVDEWWEVRVRHAVAKEPERVAHARERVIAIARKIEQMKIEWAEGPQTPAVRERLIAESRMSRVIPLDPGARGRRGAKPRSASRRGE
jgi:hypothetical protein